jgi:1-acyl-sn-glycerol-3-phosphate acyltransferase
MISWFYAFIRYTVRKYLEWKYYLKVIDLEILPASGGLILACNHTSNLDPPLVGATVTQRELYFMARSTLFDIPVMGTIIRHLNAVPIIRGAGPDQDWGLYLGLLKGGKALLIFPEGTRSETGDLQRGKSGFGRLVHMSQVPVFPVYIQGAFEAYPKHGPKKRVPITMIYGPQVDMADLLAQGDEKRNLREISERTMQAIAKLKAELEQRQKG